MSVAYATSPLVRQISLARVMLGMAIASLGSFNHLPLTQVHFLLGSAPYYFLVVLGIFLLARNGLVASRPLFVAFLLVLAACMLSICANLPKIVYTESLRASGSARAVTTTLSWVIYFGFAAVCFSVAGREKLDFLFFRRMVVLSFTLLLPYYFLEILTIQGNSAAESILRALEAVLHVPSVEGFAPRVRGLTQEPSYLGVYLAFAYPWLLSFAEGIGWIWGGALVGSVWIVAVYSLSKTALGTLLLLTIIYAFARASRLSFKRILGLSILGLMLVLAVYISSDALYEQNIAIWLLQYEESGVDFSTITRFGSQFAAIGLWLDNIVFGVGPGFSGAYLPDYYPNWMLANSNEIQVWTALSKENLGAPTFSIYTRILAEYGVFGAIVACGILASLISKMRGLVRSIQLTYGERAKIGVFLMSLGGCLFAFLGLDGIGFPGFWILLGLFYWLVESDKHLIEFVRGKVSIGNSQPRA